MKWTILFFVLIGVALASCESARKSGFWVNWTFARSANEPQPAPEAHINPRVATPQPTPSRQLATNERRAKTQATPQPTAAPQSPKMEIPASAPDNPAPVASPKPALVSPENAAQSSAYPYARPVPGKPGYVFSPYDTKGGYVNVIGYNRGDMVKDPYSGKIFLVP
jgi:hypothetical protein